MTDANAVVIERSFDAPLDVVWTMWTVPEHVAAWYGPDGARVTVAEMDVRAGGRRLVCMEIETPNGPLRMWLTGEYLEVVEHRLLVYTDSRSDEDGNVLSAEQLGMPGHPLRTEVRVELSEVDGRTRMVMTHAGIPADSPGAAGWAMALDKLATRVAAYAG